MARPNLGTWKASWMLGCVMSLLESKIMFPSTLLPVMLNKLWHCEGFVTAGIPIPLDLMTTECLGPEYLKYK